MDYENGAEVTQKITLFYPVNRHRRKDMKKHLSRGFQGDSLR
jgi:hypothetical protein